MLINREWMSRSKLPRVVDALRAAPPTERRRLRPALVPGFFHDRRNRRIGDEALPALLVPVEHHPHAVFLIRVAEDHRAVGTVRLSLLRALVREHLHESVEVLYGRRCQDHRSAPSIN